MYEKRDEATAAALALVQASEPHDEFCIINFDDEVFNGLPNDEDFTSDIQKIKEAISRIDVRGGKAMRTAVQTGIEYLGRVPHDERRMLVLITEGDDTSSKLTQGELLEKVKRSGIPVYCMGLLSEGNPQRQEAARLALGQLADESGGLAFYPKSAGEAEQISRQILNEVRKP